MIELPSQDITVRTHLFPGGERARGMIFVGRLGAFRFEASRDLKDGWSVQFGSEPETPDGLCEPLLAAALSSISVAEGLHRHPPPRILTVEAADVKDGMDSLIVDVRDIFHEAGIAQGFVTVPSKGRFTFQADQRSEGEWNITFGLDFTLSSEVLLQLERQVRSRIEQIITECQGD